MSRPFDIDAHGRIAPRTDEARCALADRAGRFELLPSADDLLVARRTPATGGPATGPRCVLAGDLAGLPVADLLGFVHQARLSGVLTVVAGGGERAITFQDGEVRGATSTAPGERLGDVAVRLGLASEAQVARASAAGRMSPRDLEGQGVAAADAWRCLHEQVTAVFHGVLLAPPGTFFLEDGVPDAGYGAPLSVNTQSLLMDGLRRIDELSLFRARIPGPDAVLRQTAPRRRVSLRVPEKEVLALVDGRRTVAQIATAAHLSEFDATKILHHLAEAGHVDAIAEPLAAGGAAARIPALLAGMNALLREVVAAVPVRTRPAFLAEARAFLSDEAAPFAPLLAGLAPDRDGALDEAALAARLERLDADTLARLVSSAERPRALFEALREVLLFWLFLAGGRVDAAADAALGRALRGRLVRLEALA
jgi:hypothetical protein